MELSARARIRAGDPAAFGELFDEHASVLYRYAVRVTGDWAAAEDIVSLTFLEAWRVRGRIRLDGESLRPWLFGIATNVLRNASRSARRHEAALNRMPRRDVVPDFSDELVGRLADAEELAAARTALGRLRKAEREVFTLCVWAGLNYAEAASALGVPQGTVRSRLSRARTRLRKLTDAEREPSPRGGQLRGDDRANAVRSKERRS
ncbi:RNA polymerase sigma factor [Spirillospora sp. NPDC052269]